MGARTINDPERIELLVEEAFREAGQGDYAASNQSIEKALAIDPEIGELHAWSALYILRQGNSEGAQQPINRALDLNPNSPFIHQIAGDQAAATRRRKRAETFYLNGVRLDPFYVGNYISLANFYGNRSEFDKALAWADRACTIDPKESDAVVMRGEILLEQGKFRDARHAAQTALRIDPENVDACKLMSQVELETGNLDTARDLAVEALTKNARDTDALTLLAQIRSRRNPLLAIWWRVNLLLRRFNTNTGVPLFLLLILAPSLVVPFVIDAEINSLVLAAMIFSALVAFRYIGEFAIRRMIKRDTE